MCNYFIFTNKYTIYRGLNCLIQKQVSRIIVKYFSIIYFIYYSNKSPALIIKRVIFVSLRLRNVRDGFLNRFLLRNRISLNDC